MVFSWSYWGWVPDYRLAVTEQEQEQVKTFRLKDKRLLLSSSSSSSTTTTTTSLSSLLFPIFRFSLSFNNFPSARCVTAVNSFCSDFDTFGQQIFALRFNITFSFISKDDLMNYLSKCFICFEWGSHVLLPFCIICFFKLCCIWYWLLGCWISTATKIILLLLSLSLSSSFYRVFTITHPNTHVLKYIMMQTICCWNIWYITCYFPR